MLSVDLLTWYDGNRRAFPWRAVTGAVPNPYHVWLSEIMLQQTTTTTVIPYFNHFIQKWPDVLALARADLDEILHGWQGLGYYSRARSLHKAAAILKDGFPESEQELLAIPGVGPYTAGAIAAIAYDLKTAPVDGNIGRIFSRLYKINEVKPKLYGTVKTLLTDVLPERGNGDFIQGLMDVGATICLPKEPKCHLCPLSLHCLSFQTGAQAQYPLRAPKKERPRRFGQVFWIEDDEGRVLIEKRPEKGLLGGMMGFPTTPWVEKLDFNRGEKGQVEHTFTHFHLILNVTRSVKSSKHFEGLWVHPSELKLYALPTVMKKVVKVVLG